MAEQETVRSGAAVLAAPLLDIDGDRYGVAELGGGVFLLDEFTGASRQIGPHGRRIWGLLSRGLSVEDAAWTIARETGGRFAVVLKDTRRFVADLVEVGVIVEHSR